ncbi:MAG: hypothetical protein P8N63_10435, partial [Pseudomonadales bacterium]|nr:hypothetical protein [Pseudomonadales bacterium]
PSIPLSQYPSIPVSQYPSIPVSQYPNIPISEGYGDAIDDSHQTEIVTVNAGLFSGTGFSKLNGVFCMAFRRELFS